MKRCFISIDLPEQLVSEVKRVQDSLPDFKGKKTELKNLHLTLKFLGEISGEKVEEVKKRLSKIKLKSFSISLGNVGVFAPSYVRIIWISLIGAEELQKKIDEALDGLFKKEKRFMGHLTIGRVNGIKDKKKFLEDLDKITISKIKFNAKSFELKESFLNSVGPHYETLGEYKLN